MDSLGKYTALAFKIMLAAVVIGTALAALCCRSAFAQVGDYNNIANLDYYSDMPAHGAPASAVSSTLKMRFYLATGENGESYSPQYLMDEAGQKSRKDEILVLHGFSSPRFAWQMGHDYGSCRLSLCRRGTYKITDEMRIDAMVRSMFGSQVYDVPDYLTALDELSQNHGAAVWLSTDGYKFYAIIGVDTQGRGIWLDHYKNYGQPNIFRPDVATGQSIWDDMTEGKSNSPESYRLLIK